MPDWFCDQGTGVPLLSVQFMYSSQQLLCGIDDSTTFNASGTSFVDMDQDGLYGPGDLPVPWTQVAVSPQTGSLFTLDSGQFVFASADTGSFTFTATPPGPWWVLSSDSASYTVHLDSLSPIFDSLDFGWASAFDTTVVTTALIGTSTCTGNSVYSVQIHNQGTTRPELLLTLALDSQLTLVNSSPPVDSIQGNTLYWHIDSLDPFASWSAALQVTMPWLQNLGDTLNTTFSTYELDGFGNDTLISDALWSDIILCAYDPNDKRVEPAGSDTANYIWPDTEWLTYTIRFQNTGNATAQTVVIEDFLSPHLQANTVQILATSHALTGLSISPYRKLAYRFDNIQLPDSASDPLASQGFVQFRIRLQPGLQVPTLIENNAGIFFDSNPPVITENAFVTVADCPYILSTALIPFFCTIKDRTSSRTSNSQGIA